MTEQKTERKISSFVAPTEDDIAYFESLPATEQNALLKAEIDKGFASPLSERTFEQVVADARSRFEARRQRNG
jgi:hypothetical protein